MVTFGGYEIKLYGIRLKLSRWYLYGCIYIPIHYIMCMCVCVCVLTSYCVKKIVARNDEVPDEIEKK